MNYRKQQWILAVVMSALLALVIGCGKKVQPPPPQPPALKPPTATLSANPTSIQRGQSATLNWSTDSATDITLEGNKVEASGTQTVSPTDTTTYHLSAKGAGGTQDATATISVVAPPPPPPPTPAPTVTDEKRFDDLVTDIYFDYDKADLRPESQQMLLQAAEIAKAHPEWKIQIEGNCDERGSGMYNLALGERRADAARQVLAQGGVGTAQLKTISYGKEKPVCTQSSEDCWQKNRHDHFVRAQQ